MSHDRSPIFVVGAQRSGTTLTGRWLNDHPEVFCTVDGKLLYYLIVWLLRDPHGLDDRHARLDEIVHALYRDHYRRRGASDDARRLADVLGNTPPSALDGGGDVASTVAATWLRCYRALAGDGAALADKYNEYLLQLDDIATVFPDARFLFVVRDPVATVESMLRHFDGRPWQPATAAETLAKWTAWNRHWLAFRARLPAGRRVEVRYEDMVAAPERTAARIQGALGLAGDRGHRHRLAERIHRHFALGHPRPAGGRNAAWVSCEARQIAERLGYADVAAMVDHHAS